MDKLAAAEYPVMDLIRRRWSPHAFAARPVERDKLLSLFEAARWSSSCYNDQPWNYIYACREDSEAWERLASCLVEANAVWARSAPVLALSIARLRFTHNGQPNRHAWYDTGQATALLGLQATELGLYVHQMGGFSPDRAREVLAIPEGYEPAAMMAIGYLGDGAALPEHLRQREESPRVRRPVREFVFDGRWGKPPAGLGLLPDRPSR